MRIAAVTTFNRKGWDAYARRMVRSFEEMWPRDIPLWVYAEGVPECEGSIDLIEAYPALPGWRTRHSREAHPEAHGKTRDGYSFRFDAVRFSHKVFAQAVAMRRAIAEGFDRLIWMDADTVTLKPIPRGFIEGLLPEGADVAYLSRAKRKKENRRTTESGFIVYSTSELARRLVFCQEAQYLHDGVFRMAKWHDGFVFDRCREFLEASEGLVGHSLSGGFEDEGHPFVAGPLGEFMDHLKGLGSWRSDISNWKG